MNERECLCLDCIYGIQPYGYFPIVCVHGKEIKEMWHEVFNCKYHFPAPEPPKMEPWKVIINK